MSLKPNLSLTIQAPAAFSIHRARGDLAAGRLSAVELLRHHLEVISRVNPLVNALPTLCADRAMAEAKAIDRLLVRSRRSKVGATLGPLSGLPYCAKDIFDTEGIRTTYGSPIFAGHVPTKDAEIVRRIRSAGGLLIGKSNTPEFAAGSQTFNQVFGATKNPWDLDKTCGGSSGGAAVALATGMAMLADGSDLAASLRNPASFCGVVGLRPSTHLEPRLQSGTNAFGTLSMVGPMARTVADLRELFLAIFDPKACAAKKSLSEWSELRTEQANRRAKSRKPGRKIKLAWAPDWGGLAVEHEVLDVMARVRKKLGQQVQWRDEFPRLADYRDAFMTLRAAYFVSEFGGLYQQHRSQLKDTVIWNIEQGLSVTAAQIARAEKIRTELFVCLEQFMAQHDLDGIVGPTNQVLPFGLDQPYVSEINGRALETYVDWLASNFLVTVAGLPALSIPAGFSQPVDSRPPLPVGLQIVGRWSHDMELMDTAQQIEQLLGPEAHSLKP